MQVVISLSRMNRIREIDARNETIVAEAGVILAQLQAAAADAGKYFPFHSGAEGSCTIVGGNLASNAGGSAVLRYGNMRDLTLGIEVVLPDGNIWNGLCGLQGQYRSRAGSYTFSSARKARWDHYGRGAEAGSVDSLQSHSLRGLASPDAAVDLLSLMKDHCGDRIDRIRTDVTPERRLRVAARSRVLGLTRACHPWYVLIQLSDTLPDTVQL